MFIITDNMVNIVLFILNVIAIERANKTMETITSLEMVFREGDLLVAAGGNKDIKKIAKH